MARAGMKLPHDLDNADSCRVNAINPLDMHKSWHVQFSRCYKWPSDCLPKEFFSQQICWDRSLPCQLYVFIWFCQSYRNVLWPTLHARNWAFGRRNRLAWQSLNALMSWNSKQFHEALRKNMSRKKQAVPLEAASHTLWNLWMLRRSCTDIGTCKAVRLWERGAIQWSIHSLGSLDWAKVSWTITIQALGTSDVRTTCCTHSSALRKLLAH